MLEQALSSSGLSASTHLPGILFDHGCESLRRLERRNLAGRYDDRRLLGYIASSLLCALLDDKATEASEVDIVSLAHSILDCIHKSLYNLQDLLAVQACRVSYVLYNFCFSHVFLVMGLINDLR